MRPKKDVIHHLTASGVIAVVRVGDSSCLEPLTAALIRGGLTLIEITLTTPNALQAIRELSTRHREAVFGVGSVTTAEACRQAVQAGAEFVVSPITRKEIAEAAHALDRPVMLGAYTPTEAQTAHEAGADFIKLFPADKLGPAYIKALRAPLPHLRIVPTGGVDLQTITDFFRAGCAAVGVGGALLSPTLLQNQQWEQLSNLARAFVEATAAARA